MALDRITLALAPAVVNPIHAQKTGMGRPRKKMGQTA
jgi:hypothetical protein